MNTCQDCPVLFKKGLCSVHRVELHSYWTVTYIYLVFLIKSFLHISFSGDHSCKSVVLKLSKGFRLFLPSQKNRIKKAFGSFIGVATSIQGQLQWLCACVSALYKCVWGFSLSIDNGEGVLSRALDSWVSEVIYQERGSSGDVCVCGEGGC